jgi:hypothetical protein
MSRTVSARIALLDNQVVDCHRLPVGRVDDLEIEIRDRKPRVTAILTGSEALGDRIGGSIGAAMAAASARLRPRSQEAGPPRIPISAIRELEPLLELDVELDELPQVAGLEHWLAANFIERLPGSGDASE